MSQQSAESVQSELTRLVNGFFEAVSFEVGATPSYGRIHEFVDRHGSADQEQRCRS